MGNAGPSFCHLVLILSDPGHEISEPQPITAIFKSASIRQILSQPPNGATLGPYDLPNVLDEGLPPDFGERSSNEDFTGSRVDYMPNDTAQAAKGRIGPLHARMMAQPLGGVSMPLVCTALPPIESHLPIHHIRRVPALDEELHHPKFLLLPIVLSKIMLTLPSRRTTERRVVQLSSYFPRTKASNRKTRPLMRLCCAFYSKVSAEANTQSCSESQEASWILEES